MPKSGAEMTRAEKIEAHHRNAAYADQILEMFAAGASYGVISRATGVPRSTVGRMVKDTAAKYVEERYGDRNTALGRELALLDALTRKNLRAAMNGNKDAAAICLQASRDRRRLLGLDAALRSEITVKTPKDVEIEQLMQMLRANDARQPDTGVPTE
jgi:hypothetical protein